MTMLSPETLARPSSALPFWLSLGLIPVVLLSFSMGGLFVCCRRFIPGACSPCSMP